MTTVHREVERKYALDAGAGAPTERAWAALPGVEAVRDGGQHHLEATYCDTAGLRLATARTTLRRRTGGDDAGWHLKLPSLDGARAEVRLPLGDEPDGDALVVPDELARLARAASGGEPLAPVARLVTERSVLHLLGPGGVVLAEVAEDQVTATRLARGEQVAEQTWRELEVELVDAPEDQGGALLDAAEAVLAAAGITPSPSASKLARALGTPSSPAPGPELTPAATAGAVVVAHLRAQVRQMVDHEPHLRLDVPDAVHQVRVASRRLRSALKTFRPVLDRTRVRLVRDELRWYAGVLGGARDAEVLRERLAGAARADAGWAAPAGAPDEAEATALAIEAELGEEHARAHAAVVEALDGERYRALVAAVEALVADPPLTTQGRLPASQVLLRRVRRTHRELRELVGAALDTPPGEERDVAVHEARKAGKRARYAAEALSTVWPGAAEYAKATKRLQTDLGDHQDSVVARAALHRLAATERGAPHAFALGRLHGLEQAAADRAEVALPELWEAASTSRARRWMKG
ncbi:MAG: CHAD domain containing protein [uncultured Quadrisphaera sp.]|uniref:CHAD domain containing protein n=1 Tax=uncultured Quadrisphaera sp. TaxID=904978 RepID=A0A6J4Q8B4_9ACTN|nr:MAG: CHAD domain containing protein [uncultured Quadrisphaera sp.]